MEGRTQERKRQRKPPDGRRRDRTRQRSGDKERRGENHRNRSGARNLHIELFQRNYLNTVREQVLVKMCEVPKSGEEANHRTQREAEEENQQEGKRK